MKGGFRFEHVLGLQRAKRAVGRDFILARKAGDVRYGKYFLFYPEMTKWMYIGYDEIVWAYRRLEEVRGVEMHFLMLVTKEKKRFGVPVGEKENALTGLKMIQEHNGYIDIGYAKEKEGQYL